MNCIGQPETLPNRRTFERTSRGSTVSLFILRPEVKREKNANYAHVKVTRTYTISIRYVGETEKLVELLLEGYDHILDAEDDGINIIDAAAQRDHEATVQFLQSIPNYVVS